MKPDTNQELEDGATMVAEGISRDQPSEEHHETGAFKAELSRYVLGEKLGAGGMAAVFRATDTKTGQVVALKIIEDGDDDASRRTRFEREVRAAGRLIHPNICRVISFGKAPAKLFMAMEVVEGVTLQKVIKLRGTLPVPIALEALRQLLSALDVAGRAGVVHRDLKPANIMVTPEGTVKLLDFGIAKSQEDATVTATGLLIGTPAFMSPEQILGGVVDGRSDLFSAGVTFLVSLTGRTRYQGLDPAAVMVKVTTEPVASLLEECPTASNSVDRFLARLCTHSLDARFQSAAEALEAMAKLEESLTPEDGPALLARYIREPDAVATELARAVAHGELARADKLIRRGEPAWPAAAIALYRASLLDPAEPTRRKLAELCAKARITFEPVDDVKIAEAHAAFDKTPTAPGVVKRLADLYRAHGQVLYAAAFLTRYLRIKPSDSHAAQQLSVMVDGPDGGTGPNSRLHTRDIMAGIKTGGHVDPALARKQDQPTDPPAKGPLTAAGLRAPAPPAVASPPSRAAAAPSQTGTSSHLDLHTRPVPRPVGAARPAGTTGMQQAPVPQVVIHTTAAPTRSSINVSPLMLLIAAVVVAGVVLALFSKFVKTSVDVVQQEISDNEQRQGRYERNSIERMRVGHLEDARAQLERGSPSQAIHQVNLLLATDPPAEYALEGLYLRAKGRMALKDHRAARVDLDEYLRQSSLNDPRREDVKKQIEKILAEQGGGDPSIAPRGPAPAAPQLPQDPATAPF